jgi:Flp pilus assembly protein TadB
VSPLDRPVPPPGEHIHLPGASAQPVLLAFAITLALVGVTIGLPILVAGLILTVWIIVRWVRDTRREMRELPEDISEH